MSHAVYSPSSATRWFACPGSIRQIAGRESPGSPDSRRGTFVHDIASKALNSGKAAAAYVGLRSDPPEFVFEPADAVLLQEYLDAVRTAHRLAGPNAKLLVEARVQVTDEVYGTADAIVVDPDGRQMDVYDLKWGAGVYVDAQDNKQTLIYALGALLQQPPGRQINTIGVHIVQPRFERAEPWRSEQYSTAQLVDFHDRTLAAVVRAKASNAPLVPGDHCKFCPATADCPALRERALATAQRVFTDPSHPPTPPEVKAIAATLSPDDTALILGAIPLVELWISAVRDHSERLLRAGTPVPGWKLVAGLGNRKWAIPDDELATLLRQANVDPYVEPTVASPAEIERRLKKSGADVKLDGLTVRPQTGAKVVPESDPRPALSAGPLPFNTIENQQ